MSDETDTALIHDRVAEIANAHCADYPNISRIDAFEKLWAIESTLSGIKMANNDMHKALARLIDRIADSGECPSAHTNCPKGDIRPATREDCKECWTKFAMRGDEKNDTFEMVNIRDVRTARARVLRPDETVQPSDYMRIIGDNPESPVIRVAYSQGRRVSEYAATAVRFYRLEE